MKLTTKAMFTAVLAVAASSAFAAGGEIAVIVKSADSNYWQNVNKGATAALGKANGYTRQTGFDITAASEVMAIVAVASDLQDLRRAEQVVAKEGPFAVQAEQVQTMAQRLFDPNRIAITLLGRLDGVKLTRKQLVC